MGVKNFKNMFLASYSSSCSNYVNWLYMPAGEAGYFLMSKLFSVHILLFSAKKYLFKDGWSKMLHLRQKLGEVFGGRYLEKNGP